jgi:hypothetical protein
LDFGESTPAANSSTLTSVAERENQLQSSLTLDFGEDDTTSTPVANSAERAIFPTVSVPSSFQISTSPVARVTTDEERAATRLAAAAERSRKYRASLSEEQKRRVNAKAAERIRIHRASLTDEQRTEIRRKATQRQQMNRSLQLIQKRVASTDFTHEDIYEVIIHKHYILLSLKLPNI